MPYAHPTLEQRRAKRRRNRASRYARGLTSEGTPVRVPALSNALRVYGPHVPPCTCYDCLFVWNVRSA